MRDEGDYADYVHARWPVLVAALEAEGVAADDARLVVAEALLERRRGWARRVREEDVDAVLWADLRERAGLPGRSWERPPLVELPPGGATDTFEDWEDRAAAVRRRRGRRTARRVGVAAAVALAVLAGLVWWEVRPRPPAVREEANPIPVAWYAGGELHLADVVVELPGVDTFVADGPEVVVRLTTGEVVRVDADGTVSALDEPPAALDEVPEVPDLVPVGRSAVVLQGVPLPDGGWAYVLHAGRAPRDDLRSSEAGQRVLVLCDAARRCEEADLGVPPDAGVRVR